MMDYSFLITTFTTIFVIIDPIALMPIFLALTSGHDVYEKRRIAFRGCFVALIILASFIFVGEAILKFVGISMPAFRIAGGILLFLTALEMLFERRTQRRSNQAHATHDAAVFPLAIPLLAGPGAIATVVLLSAQQEDLYGSGTVLGVTAFVLFLVFLVFVLAGHLAAHLGSTFIQVMTRLMGMLLAALSVQFILDGVYEYGLAHPF